MASISQYSWQRVFTSRLAFALAALTILFAIAAPVSVRGQGLDTLVMPGKLIEGHSKLEKDCKKCHTSFKKADQNRLCLDCHKPVAEDINVLRGFHGLSPNVQGKECRTCHAEHKGRDAKIALFDEKAFDHAHTDFALKNAHETAECKSCHREKVKFRDAPLSCLGCHRKDDKHKGEFGEKCESCHNDKTWKEIKFDHDKTKFSLSGKHVDAKCEACHANNRYKDTPRKCVACHRKDDTHKSRFGEKCESCHNAVDWKSQFNHGKATKYVLLGKHATAKCEACHSKPLYTDKLPTKCISCHLKDDSHKGTLGEKCESCHKEAGWTNTNFDHNKSTKFPLFNKHKTAKCNTCHKDGIKTKLPLACVECHHKDDNESHKGKFGKLCGTCHDDKGWKPSIFDHNKATKYPLRHAHTNAKCENCHTGTLYVKDGAKALATACITCHKKDDSHKGQLGGKCEACHDERKWAGVQYDHNKSIFKLVGSHARTQCKSCHKTTQYKDAPRFCAGCHDGDDVHKRTLGGKCEFCHSPRSWKAWDYNHTEHTRFPLEFAHAKLACKACHMKAASGPGEPIPPVSRNCVGCHAADDVHSGGFSQQCERCHVPLKWKVLKPGTTKSDGRPL